MVLVHPSSQPSCRHRSRHWCCTVLCAVELWWSDEHITHIFSLDRFQVISGLLGHDLMIGCGVSAVLRCYCHFRVLKCTEPTMHLTEKRHFIWAQIMAPLALSSLLLSEHVTAKKASKHRHAWNKAVYCSLDTVRGLWEPCSAPLGPELVQPWLRLCKTATAMNETHFYIGVTALGTQKKIISG